MIDGMSWSFRCRIVFTFLDMYMSPRALVPYAHILLCPAKLLAF